MNYLEEIREMMKRAEINDIDFLWKKRHYIQKDGVRFEILTIHAPEDGDNELMLSAIPSYGFSLRHLLMNRTWSANSWRHVRDIVKRGIEKMMAG